jgi:hypothetical protein
MTEWLAAIGHGTRRRRLTGWLQDVSKGRDHDEAVGTKGQLQLIRHVLNVETTNKEMAVDAERRDVELRLGGLCSK